MPLAVKVLVHDANGTIISNNGTTTLFSKRDIIIIFVIIINHNLQTFFTCFCPFRFILACFHSISPFKAFKGI